MSYAWVGAPTVFNGTNPETGGNSGETTGTPPWKDGQAADAT